MRPLPVCKSESLNLVPLNYCQQWKCAPNGQYSTEIGRRRERDAVGNGEMHIIATVNGNKLEINNQFNIQCTE